MDAITLDQLRVFVAVAEQGSFSAAARHLGRAQSAVSYAIGNLENLLDVELFERTGRRPKITEAGRALLADARNVTHQAAKLAARARSMADGIEPRVSLAVDVMFPIPTLVCTLSRFHEHFPSVSLKVHEGALGGVSKLVLDGTCQIGISGPLEQFPAELVTRKIGSIHMVPVVSRDHPTGQERAPIPMTELRRYIQIVLTDRTRFTEGVDRGVLSERTWRVGDLGTKKAFLLAGFGWGNMPRHMVAEELDAGDLQVLEVEGWPRSFELPLHAVHAATAPPGNAGRWLLEELEENAED